MAEPTATVLNPQTGQVEEYDRSQLPRAYNTTGAQELTSDELAAHRDKQHHDENLGETFMANQVGRLRGAGEAVGIATDPFATSVADLFGKGNETRAYLNDLKKYHPYATGAGELYGQTAGAIAGGELLGGGDVAAQAPSVAGRVGRMIGGGALRGGLENLVIGSTHDVNETALGNADLAGEKLFAEMPKHFVTGVVAGGVISAGGAALGELGAALKKPVSEALDHQASAAVGREVGGGLAEGSALRERMGGVPRSTSEVADFLTKEQAGFREGSAREAGEARSLLEDAHTTAAWQQSAKSEAAREISAREAKAAVEAVESRHAAARDALKTEHAEATSTFGALSEERARLQSQIKTLASDLDKVKGAELPNAQNVMRSAADAFSPPDPSLTPPSPRAVEIFNEWTDTFGKRFGEAGKLKFTDLNKVIESLGEMEKRQRVVSGWGNDPEVQKAFASIKSAAKAEFDRASEVTAGAVSEAKGLHASQLRARLPELDTAVAAAEDNLDRIGGVMKDFERGAAQEVRQAERDGFRAMRSQDKLSSKEESILDRQQRTELRGLPKASKATPVDAQLKAARESAEGGGLISGGAAIGVGASLLHGNVAGAAMSALGGLAANTARTKGNLLAARVMSSLADSIAKADGQIARLAGRAVGRYARVAADKELDDESPKRPKLTFEKASQRVQEAAANPLIIEQRVRAAAGHWASDAPDVYSSLLAAAQRSQDFLASKLPTPRTDPYSLTSHLETGDVSDTEKYDFMQYTKAVADPVGVLKNVADGSVTPQQVEALQEVYPQLYSQMRTEVLRRVADLDHPLDYEKEVNIGTLLDADTNEVMTGEFQSMLADMYTARTKDEDISGGSQPKGVNSRLSKSTASAAQQMQTGDL